MQSSHFSRLVGGAVGVGAAAIVAPGVASAQASHPASFKAIDGDHDGTIDTTEAIKAASAKFDAADTDHDGTLTAKELAAAADGAALAKWFDKIDTDHDGTISKAEYLAAVRAQFVKADPDKDGTLSAAEWSASGAATLRNLVSK